MLQPVGSEFPVLFAACVQQCLPELLCCRAGRWLLLLLVAGLPEWLGLLLPCCLPATGVPQEIAGTCAVVLNEI